FMRRALLAALLLALVGLPLASVRVGVRAAGSILGTVYQDYNDNGLRDTGTLAPNIGFGTYVTAVDRGLAGVVVTAFDGANAVQGSTATTATGAYTLTVAGAGPYRIEFTNFPAGYFPSAHGANNGPTIRYVPDGSSANIDLGLNLPADYCQNNPEIITSCYTFGDQLTGPNVLTTTILSFPYSAGSSSPSDAASYDQPTTHSVSLRANQVGTTWGLALARNTGRLYAAALMKKHTGYGPGGPGAIYVINPVSNTVVATYTVPNATTNAHDPGGDYVVDNGNVAWDAVGKTSLGGMDMAPDDSRLFVMNLEDRTLYALNPATGAVLGSQAMPLNPPLPTSTCPANDVRPFAVEYFNGLVYVGVVCSAETSQNPADLRAYLYTADPTTLAFSAAPVFEIALNYPRGLANDGLDLGGNPVQFAEWNPWAPTFTARPPNFTDPNANFPVYPQPMFTGLAFDANGDMIIGLRDRFGDQTGNESSSDPANPANLYFGVPGGDTLRACANGSGGWTLESNGRCNAAGSAPQNTGQGPGDGEYYFVDDFSTPANSGNFHDEVSLGGVLQMPGFPDVVATMFDPIPRNVANEFGDAGARWLSNTAGSISKGYRLYNGAFADGRTFAKANGLGDLEVLCAAAPVEIGNYVWRDDDRDGVQDPNELPLAAVTLRLYTAGGDGVFGTPDDVLVATTQTDANGQYYFTNLTDGDPDIDLTAGTQFQIRLATVQTALTGLQLTMPNSDTTPNGDSRDSDGAPVGGDAIIALTIGGAGQNNHTYDFGFNPVPTAVTLTSFGITALTDSEVTLAWATAAEVDNFAFALYRSPSNDFDEATLIHVEPSKIPGGTGSGAQYAYVDAIPSPGPWWYWLGDVDTRGRVTLHPAISTLNGPSGSGGNRLFLPVIFR
ncbi:MAG: SdrD B-like domain-containing protein, partial [Anaerolineales bacterium]